MIATILLLSQLLKKDEPMKILIFGCGVIGSVYATRFASAGYDVTVYARGRRLQELQKKGLLYRKNQKVYRSRASVSDSLAGTYDFVFVTVKFEQLLEALQDVRQVNCGNIVTMVNNPYGYDECERVLGAGRLIPAFPGAGGVIENGVLKADLTPAIIQKTTYGEVSGKHTRRLTELGRIFRHAGIPSEECPNMMDWQLCHLGLVVPLADAIYHGNGDNYTAGRIRPIMLRAAEEVQRNLSYLKKTGMTLRPAKLNLLLKLPRPALASALAKLYCSDFGTKFIYGHSKKAKTEMMTLRNDYYNILKERA